MLRRIGVELVTCRNVTDVDDVLDAAAERAGARFDSFAAVGQFRFDRDMAALGVRPPTHEPRAHNHVDGVVALAAALLERGAAYERDGAVLFRAGQVPAPDVPADPDETSSEAPWPGADDPADALVWRPASPGEAAWPSPWGDGRPGWHAECAAMALTMLGPAVDLHIGGADLRHPHHTHQAAMVEAVTGVRPFARARLHVGTVRVDGEKMAKSAGQPAARRRAARDPPGRRGAPAAARPAVGAAPGTSSRARSTPPRPASSGSTPRPPGPGGAIAAADAVIERLLDDLDVPGALAVAEDEGGEAARAALAVLGLA